MTRGMNVTNKEQLERIFHPKRIAVIGVSGGNNFGYGSRTIITMQLFGYQGELYPVNPKGGNHFRIENLQNPGRDPRGIGFGDYRRSSLFGSRGP